MSTRKTKEDLLDMGFVSVGMSNRFEYLAKILDSGSFAYYILSLNGTVLNEHAKTSNIDEAEALYMIREKLFN